MSAPRNQSGTGLIESPATSPAVPRDAPVGSSRFLRCCPTSRLRARSFRLDGRQQRIDGPHLQPIAFPQAIRHCADESTAGFLRHGRLLLSGPRTEAARGVLHPIEKASGPRELGGQHRQPPDDCQRSWSRQHEHRDAGSHEHESCYGPYSAHRCSVQLWFRSPCGLSRAIDDHRPSVA